MSEFRFKKFSVSNCRSAMKVNTDGVLLGASMTIDPTYSSLLDIGTGTGTIALMAAQRLHALPDGPQPSLSITAIDIDPDSAAEAADNFAASPWPSALEAVEASLSAFDSKLSAEAHFDLIFSNPPYYDNSLQAKGARRNDARHTMSLSYREIVEFASRRLSPSGRLALVLPSDLEPALLRKARSRGLQLTRILRIRTVACKQPSRIVAEFMGQRPHLPVVEEELTLQEGGNRTAAYSALTADFYL